MDIPPQYLWLVLGGLCLALEAFGVTGVGFLFAGLGAMVTGILVQAGVVGADAYMAQLAWFFGLTVLWALVLWKPIRRLNARKNSAGYQNMVGDEAEVASLSLNPEEGGQVRWSGTLMNAKLAAGSEHAVLAMGEKVMITAMQGNTVLVVPKPKH